MRLSFDLSARGTDARTEALAGLTTFLTMCYIVFVNPAILSAAGVPFAGAATATALGAGLMCILMGIATNRPIALAPGMGLNAVVAFSVIGMNQANIPWQVGMSVIFVEGALILILVLTGLREAAMNAIPINIKRAIGAGIGIFIALIGFNQGGLIRPSPATLLSLGDLSAHYVWVTLIGLASTAALIALRARGAILWGLLIAAAAYLSIGEFHSAIGAIKGMAAADPRLGYAANAIVNSLAKLAEKKGGPDGGAAGPAPGAGPSFGKTVEEDGQQSTMSRASAFEAGAITIMGGAPLPSALHPIIPAMNGIPR